jgi:SNF2 family DNA or RNA helicase
MPTIFDNIEKKLLFTLRQTLQEAVRADFCVGYFHIRGWDQIAEYIEHFEGNEESCCRVLVGMNKTPEDEMRESQSIRPQHYLDGPTVARMRRKAAESFKEQIERGVPTARAEASLRKLACQLQARKVRVKLFLQYPLHAKLYLIHRRDTVTPQVGYLGSSNLTAPGLSHQGELNVDVVEQDAANKLQRWFDDRWNDELAFDISDDLFTLIDTSWAADRLVKPYHVYLKMAYHLSEVAREGENTFKLPKNMQGVLLDFQEAAISLTAQKLHQRGGVLLGDVVGLGKTLMATAIARIFQEDRGGTALIICPPKLQEMWQWHVDKYELAAKVSSIGKAHELENEFPRRLVIIDESHNLRNRESKRYGAIRNYIMRFEPQPMVLLLTATPYNKHYTDLSNQLRLFLDEGADLRVRPERYFQAQAAQGYDESDFVAQYNALPRSLRAFEESEFADDWRDLMRYFLVRRTRQFIIRNYAKFDEERGRYYVTLGGKPSYFPTREPHTLTFALNDKDPSDQYARLYTERAVGIIENLSLARYGLTNYLIDDAYRGANPAQQAVIDNLNRAGRRLIGFHRTNLFKRLESSGLSFLTSLDHHIARNMVTLHALHEGLPVPIGSLSAALLDTAISDEDADVDLQDTLESGNANTDDPLIEAATPYIFSPDLHHFTERARKLYAHYNTRLRQRFSWLPATFFTRQLTEDLHDDVAALLSLLQLANRWLPERDTKLQALHSLISDTHPDEKVLVFTQFADTARYLGEQLRARGVRSLEVATGGASDPVALARRFSPKSNGGLRPGETPLRVLVATDVLGEGQNLQDAHIIVNYDLPWAIVRLIQRAGRVDRIGQEHDTILIYSFMPAEGVERIIRLRSRLFTRLQQNQEVIGTDESFFGEDTIVTFRDLYAERLGVFDDDAQEDMDLSSHAQQIWNSASDADRRAAEHLPTVVTAARAMSDTAARSAEPPGVITYLRYPDGTDAMVRVDDASNLISQSLTASFRSATCAPDTPALEPPKETYDWIAKGTEYALREHTQLGGQLGDRRSTRRKVYERMKLYREHVQRKSPLLADAVLAKLDPAYNVLAQFPLKEGARDALSRQLNLGANDEVLAEMLVQLYEQERLAHITEDVEQPEPQIVCSLALLKQ